MRILLHRLLPLLLIITSFHPLTVHAHDPVGVSLGNKVGITQPSFAYSRKTGTSEGKVTITNRLKGKGASLYNRLTLIVTGMNRSDVRLLNADGYTSGGLPYVLVPIPGDALGPKRTIKTVPLRFENPSKKPLKPRFEVYGLLSPNTRPTAKAGYAAPNPNGSGTAESLPSRRVLVGDVVDFTAAASTDADGHALIDYRWTLVEKPAGSVAQLTTDNGLRTRLTVDRPGTYQLQLTVNDGLSDSVPESFRFSTDNSVPAALAGPDQTLPVGAVARLDGSQSRDADGDPLQFIWTLPTKPAGSSATLTGERTASPSFSIDKAGHYEAQLTVSDGKEISAADIIAIDTENSRPVAHAGADHTATVGDTLTFDGELSSDIDLDPLSFAWSLSKPEGSAAQLTNPDTRVASLVPDVPGDYVAQLVVHDGRLASEPDTAVLTVAPKDATEPRIAAISATSASVGDQLSLTGEKLGEASSCPKVLLRDRSGAPLAAPIVRCSATETLFLIPAGAGSGPITVTVAGQAVAIPSANGPASITIVPKQDFALAVAPATIELAQGSFTTYTLTLSSTGGFSDLAELSVTGLPAGVTATLEPRFLTAGQRSTLTLTAAADAPLGSYQPTVTASAQTGSGSTGETVTLGLNVTAGGRTGLTGKFTLVDGTPLQGVVATLPCTPTPCTTTSDAGGNFAFSGDLPVGEQTLMIDTTPVDARYPKYAVTVNLVAGKARQLPPFEIMPTPPAERFTTFDNANADQKITDPRLPGVSFTLPKGVTIAGWDGTPKTRMAIEKLSPDNLPVPPPPGQTRSFYQPFWGTSSGGIPSKPLPVTAPNDLDMKPGEQAELWWYDTAPLPNEPGAWKKAGTGTVSQDGTTIVSDNGTGIPRFCGVCGLFCFVKNQAGQPNANPLGPKSGDPVDLTLGQLITEKTDLVLPGRLPAVIHRIHNPYEPFGTIAGFDLGFGTGWSLSVQAVLQSESPALQRLILPGNARFGFTLDSASGLFVMNAHPLFGGASLKKEGNNTFTLRWKDGRIWRFGPAARIASFYLLKSQTDRNGNELTIGHDTNNRIATITEPGGRTLNFTSSNGRIAAITDPIGRAIQYAYDGSGRLASVTDAGGGITRYSYDGAGRILTITDPKGIVFLRNEYSPLSGRILKQIQADGGVWQFEYHYPLSDATVFRENALTVVNPGPTLPNIAFTTVVTDPNGNRTTYSGLGADGFPDAVTNSLGLTTRFERDPAGRVTALTDPLGRVTRLGYDTLGNLLALTDPAGTTHRFEYESVFSKPVRYIDPAGNLTSFEYDAKGNLIAMTDPEQNRAQAADRLKTRIAYDAYGQPVSMMDVMGNTTRLDYDAQGNLIGVRDPLGHTVRQRFDLASRLIALTDARGQTTKIAYDALNQIVEIIDALGGKTAFDHDANGNLLSLTDARGNSTRFTYDAMDRVSVRTDPLGVTETYGYDANGNLLTHMDRKGQLRRAEYDGLNRPVKTVHGDGSVVEYGYDGGGRLTRIREPGWQLPPPFVDIAGNEIVREFDGLDRLTRETTGLGAVAYGYDTLNRRRTLEVSGHAPVGYDYDANSRLTRISQAGRAVEFRYDPLGRPTRLAMPNGVMTDVSYDAVSNPIALVYRNAQGVLGNLHYDYDAAGNRTTVNGTLARAAVPDAAGGGLYDPANRQLAFAGRQLRYDANGNLSSLDDATGSSRFTWDARNRLQSIEGPTLSAQFAYDPAGRRIGKHVQGLQIAYRYDGPDIVEELRAGTATGVLGGLGIDQPLLRGDTETMLTDALGSVIGLTDPSGNLSASYTYEPYGKTAGGEATDNPFQFTARENDGTGFYYYRARYYDPVGGRFISEDPIGFDGGNTNLYQYANLNPTVLSDWSGETSEDFQWWNDDPQIQYTNNCYSFAFDKPYNAGVCFEPGWLRDHPMKPQPGGGLSEITVESVAEGVFRDTGMTGAKGPMSCSPGSHLVYFVVWPGTDYHWYRQADDGTWWEKSGQLGVSRAWDVERWLKGLAYSQQGYYYCAKSMNSSPMHGRGKN